MMSVPHRPDGAEGEPPSSAAGADAAVRAALDQQQAYFQAVLDSLDTGIAVFDSGGRYEYASPRAVRDPDLRQRIVGMTIGEYARAQGLPDDVAEQRARSVEDSVATGQPNSFEDEVTADDGSVRYMLRRAVPVLDASGTVVHVVGYSVDVTERRRAQEEASRYAAELEQSLEGLHRTQARLVHQEKMASLGALTAGIAHELKNPLNFVTNFAALSRTLAAEAAAEADAAERRTLLADLAANAEKIEAHAKRADAIIRTMMDHARGAGGVRRAVAVGALVSEYARLAADCHRSRWPGVEVVFTLDLDPEAGEVEAVADEVGRVVVNLVDNAFDAVRQRAVHEGAAYAPAVAVAVRRAGAEVEVCVADNGLGMPEAVRARVFEPFYTTKPTGEGTGLGLSLAHDIVVQGHGGSLKVESAEGEGTTFVVRLPRGGPCRTPICTG